MQGPQELILCFRPNTNGQTQLAPILWEQNCWPRTNQCKELAVFSTAAIGGNSSLFLNTQPAEMFSAWKCHCLLFWLCSSPAQTPCQLQGYFCLSINEVSTSVWIPEIQIITFDTMRSLFQQCWAAATLSSNKIFIQQNNVSDHHHSVCRLYMIKITSASKYLTFCKRILSLSVRWSGI